MVSSISACFASKRCRAPEPPPKMKVILRVSNQQYGREDLYRIGVHVRFKKLMLHYCQKRNLDYTTLRFIYNVELLEPRQTPAQLMMKDGDIIDVVTVLPVPEQGSAVPYV